MVNSKPFPALLIVGMHRSGTSCLTGMLHQYGLFLGEVSRKSTFNAKGNQESHEVREINDQLLQAHGSSWFQPSAVETVPPLLALRIRRFRILMQRENQPWGFKDPRLLFCLDAWRQPSDQLIGTFRHPEAAAQSLHLRNNARRKKVPLALSDWRQLWYLYNRRLLTLYRDAPFPIVNFDWEPHRYRRAVQHMAGELSLPCNETAGDFFDPSLSHHRESQCSEIDNPDYKSLYRELEVIARAEEKRMESIYENNRSGL